jgi:hypothetical protein
MLAASSHHLLETVIEALAAWSEPIFIGVVGPAGVSLTALRQN